MKHDAVLIHSNIFLGSCRTAFDLAFLKSNHIDFVLCVAAERSIPSDLPHCTTLHVPFRDLSSENLSCRTDDILSFYDACDSNIIIACNQGVSRAPSVVMLILMLRFSFILSNSFHLIKEKRPQIRPNLGFMEQLVALEVSHFDRDDTSMDMLMYTFEYVCYLLSVPTGGRPFIRESVRRHAGHGKLCSISWVKVQDDVLAEFFGTNWSVILSR
ncbi:hypothetical protein GEMRC1_004809 [Eukaryota sp. GEM-RC1]